MVWNTSPLSAMMSALSDQAVGIHLKENQLKMLIVDDHQLFVDGLRCILEQEFLHVVIAHADTAILADTALKEEGSDFDLVLFDIHLPTLQSIQSIVSLKCQHPSTKFVLLSDVEDKDLIVQTITAGLDGYVPKSIGKALFVSAIGLVLSGGVYIPKTAITEQNESTSRTEQVAASRQKESHVKPANVSVLTERQRDIIKLLEEGLSNKEIARKLDISDGTVRIHVSTIYRVLNVNNRTQAVVKSRELGYA